MSYNSNTNHNYGNNDDNDNGDDLVFTSLRQRC